MTYEWYAPPPEVPENGWTLTIHEENPAPDGVGTQVHFIHIVATDETVAEWNAQFWGHFPRDASALEALARRGGVYVHADCALQPSEHTVKAQYGPYRTGKIAGHWRHWQHRLHEAPTELRALMEEYASDLDRVRVARAAAFEDLVARKLPTPPASYEWALNQGGIRGAGYGFRLWRRDFGYMPGSE